MPLGPHKLGLLDLSNNHNGIKSPGLSQNKSLPKTIPFLIKSFGIQNHSKSFKSKSFKSKTFSSKNLFPAKTFIFALSIKIRDIAVHNEMLSNTHISAIPLYIIYFRLNIHVLILFFRNSRADSNF